MQSAKIEAMQIIDRVLNGGFWRRQIAMMAYIGGVAVISCMVITHAQARAAEKILTYLHQAKHSSHQVGSQLSSAGHQGVQGHY